MKGNHYYNPLQHYLEDSLSHDFILFADANWDLKTETNSIAMLKNTTQENTGGLNRSIVWRSSILATMTIQQQDGACINFNSGFNSVEFYFERTDNILFTTITSSSSDTLHLRIPQNVWSDHNDFDYTVQFLARKLLGWNLGLGSKEVHIKKVVQDFNNQRKNRHV